jgi:hypothetical protein
MDARRLWQLARIPVLLALLASSDRRARDLVAVTTRLDTAALWPAWIFLVAIMLGFATVMLVGRSAHHPVAILGLEAALAAILGLVPPMYLVLWFGVGRFSGTLLVGLVQPLALTWLVVVVSTAVRQLRRAGDATSSP